MNIKTNLCPLFFQVFCSETHFSMILFSMIVFSMIVFSVMAFLIIIIIKGTIMPKISIIGMEIMMEISIDSQIINNLININTPKRKIRNTLTPKIIIQTQGQMMIFMTYSHSYMK